MKKFFVLFFLIVVSFASNAQCAMCKAVVESNQSSGLADGLNTGIVYLMIFPYILLGGLGYLLYRQRRKKHLNTH